MFRKDVVDRQEDGGKKMDSNRPNKRKVLNHFLSSDCFAYAPSPHRLEWWSLPIRIPRDRIETVESIRQSLAQFVTLTRLTEAEREEAWMKLTAAARKHGIDVPDQMPPMPRKTAAPRYNLSATHRMTVTL